MRNNRPIAVLISDVHYNVHMLKLADAAMRMAINKANELQVPLIVAGDLHDTKANLRGECVNAMRATFKQCAIKPYILRGNHDAINEKSKEHSLNFLEDLATIVDEPGFFNELGSINGNSIHLIPYQHDPEELKSYLKKVDKNSCIIMHQGVTNANSGDYIQDKSALPRECFADYRVISGHYHTRQHIKCGHPRQGSVGLFSYIGNPYTLNYGEANDPEKGFQILMSDGSLEFIPTNLRRHRIVTCGWDEKYNLFWGPIMKGKVDDLVWVKVEGSREQLQVVTKLWLEKQGYETFSGGNFKLDLIPIDTKSQVSATKNLTKGPLIDSIIDGLTNTSNERKERLKSTWKELV